MRSAEDTEKQVCLQICKAARAEEFLRAWSVAPGSETDARQNETLWVCKTDTGRVFRRVAGQFRGIALGGLGLCHACEAAPVKYNISHNDRLL